MSQFMYVFYSFILYTKLPSVSKFFYACMCVCIGIHFVHISLRVFYIESQEKGFYV